MINLGFFLRFFVNWATGAQFTKKILGKINCNNHSLTITSFCTNISFANRGCEGL